MIKLETIMKKWSGFVLVLTIGLFWGESELAFAFANETYYEARDEDEAGQNYD